MINFSCSREHSANSSSGIVHCIGLKCWIDVASGLLRGLILEWSVKSCRKSFIVGVWVGECVPWRGITLIIALVVCKVEIIIT